MATALKSQASAFIDCFNTPRDFDRLRQMLHPTTISVQHDDYPPTTTPDAFITQLERLVGFASEFHMVITDMVAEVDEGTAGGKVWCFSTITGLPGEVNKHSVDMIRFDGEGKLVECRDVQREINTSTGEGH